MDLFDLLALLTSLAAAVAWANQRWVGLPPAIGLVLAGLGFSLVVVVLGRAGFAWTADVEAAVRAVDFDEALLHGMLGALLFAGALHLDLGELAGQWRIVGLLASAGVVLSTAVVGASAWWLFGVLGFELPLLHALILGAVVAPTDPIAVLAIVKRLPVPKSLEIKIAGESLFNDGVAVVVFLALVGLLGTGGHAEETAGAGAVLRLFALEALGGVAFGLALGGLAYGALRRIDAYQVEILVTLAVVTGGYAAAQALHVSGPLAMVVAGLFVGNRGRRLAMSERTRERLDAFWELVDEFLNAILFLLVGLELVVLRLDASGIAAGLLLVPCVLLARFVAVALPVTALRRVRPFSPHAITVLTWGGLRGGISLALALSLPDVPSRDLLVSVTYVVVCFSLLVQGLSMAPLLRRLYGPAQR